MDDFTRDGEYRVVVRSAALPIQRNGDTSDVAELREVQFRSRVDARFAREPSVSSETEHRAARDLFEFCWKEEWWPVQPLTIRWERYDAHLSAWVPVAKP